MLQVLQRLAVNYKCKKNILGEAMNAGADLVYRLVIHNRRVKVKQKSGFTNAEKYKSLEDLQKESVELCLTYCGLEECDAGHRVGPNRRKCYVLHVVIEGKGIYETKDKVYHLQKGDAFLIYPGQECYYEADEENPWSYIWVGFVGMKGEECMIHSGFSKKNQVKKVANLSQLYTLVNSMLEAHDLTYANELKRNGLLSFFLAQLMEEYSKQVSEVQVKCSNTGSGYVKNAIACIAKNYTQKIRIHELADSIGINRSYLTSSFKKATGCSPQEYLLNLRMEKAKSLLKQTDMPINVISNTVGYTDQLAFSRIFKQHSGLSPKAYREVGKMSEELVVYNEKGEHKNAFL